MANDLIIKTIFKAIDRISGPVKRMSSGVSKFSRNAARSMGQVNRITRELGRTISRGVTRGLKLATVGVVALGAAMAKIIGTGAEFERSMVSATAKFPEGIKRGTKEFDALESKVREIGATTEFKATQAAEALNFLAMAGFNATQASAALPGVVDLATASNMDLATATDIASDSLNAFGLATKDASKLGSNLARVNDVLLKTTTSTNTTMEDLFEAVKAGAPTVTAAGQSIETFGAIVGTLADAGNKGESAGTALRNMFLRIQAPVGAARGLIRKYIGDIKNADGSMIDIVEVIRRLQGSFKSLGKVEQAQILDTMFGKRAIGGVQVLLAKGADGIETLRQRLLDAKGAAAGLAGEMRDTTAGSIDNLKSAVESVIISLFKLDDSGIKGVIDAMTGWVRANEKLIVQKIGDTITELKENFDDLVKSAKYIGAVVGTVWLLTSAIRVASGAMTLFNLVAAANPLGLAVTAAIISIGFLVATIATNWEDIKITTGWLVDDIIDSFLGLGSWFVDVWINGIVKGFDWLVLYFKTLFTGPIEGIKMGFEGVLNVISTAILKIGALMRMIPGVGMAMGAIDWVLGNDREASKNYIPPGKIPVPKVAPPAIPNGAEYYRGRDGADGASAPQVQSPAARAAAIERSETKTTREGRLTILNESGRETSYAGDDLLDMGISMQPTGTF